MDFTSVATGINASVIAESAYTSNNPSNNGSINGDIRINAATNASAKMSITLWDASAGTGFDTQYNPGVNYDWNLNFFDLDGRPASSWDVVTLMTEGEYAVSENSGLGLTTSDLGHVSFRGRGIGDNVPGEAGLSTPITEEQANAMVSYTVENLSSVEFTYTVVLGSSGTAAGRNLLIDGGSLNIALDPFSPVTGTVVAVPEPSSLAAILLTLMGSMFYRRRA